MDIYECSCTNQKKTIKKDQYFEFYGFITNIQMLTKLLDTASFLKAKIRGDQLELALNQATNDDNWQASTTVLHEISSSAYNHQKWKKIHDFLWEKLKNNRNWRKILKVLNIVQFLIKNGPGFAVNEFKYHANFFATLTSYQEIEDGTDRGASIRERAKAILGVLQNEELLQDERLRAKQIRQKMSHFSGSSSWNSEEGQKAAINNKYQSFNSKTFQKTDQKGQSQTFYNYGSGNYGDREQDIKYDHDYFQNLNRFNKPDNTLKTNPQIPQNREFTKGAQKLAKKQSPNKAKFDSLTKKLSMNSNKNVEGIVKPDLSYKKKEPQQNLIDIQAYFVQTKYHLHEDHQESVPQKTVEPTSQPKQEPLPAKKQPDLLSQLQGLSFQGSQTSQQKESQPQTPVQNKLIQNNPPMNTSLPPVSHIPPTNAPIINYSLTYNQMGPVQPTYYPPYALNPNQSAYGYNANPYQQMPSGNPYANMPSYQQPSYLQYNQTYPPQFTQGYSGNPYQNYDPNALSGISISMKADPVEQKKPKPIEPTKKINEQNLTDLTDLVSQIGKQTKNKQNQKTTGNRGINNNLKIDPWAW